MKRNKYWRRQQLVQKYITRLKLHAAYSDNNWCDIYNERWTLGYKTTGTPCSCWMCRGESYNREQYKKESKLEIEMF